MTTITAPAATEIAQRVIRERPQFHLADRDTSYATKGSPVRWNAQAETLAFIASSVGPHQRTIEIGSGASTVVFAATGSRHTAISPVAYEHERITEYCDSIGVSTELVDFRAESSDRVLPALDPDDRFDLAFLDGTHAFPYAIIEWHYLRRHLPAGGLLVIDDVAIPAVGVLQRFLDADAGWRRVTIVDRRTAVFEKLVDDPEATWRHQPFNDGYPQLDFLTATDRAAAQVHHWRRAVRNRASGMPRVRALVQRLRR